MLRSVTPYLHNYHNDSWTNRLERKACSTKRTMAVMVSVTMMVSMLLSRFLSFRSCILGIAVTDKCVQLLVLQIDETLPLHVTRHSTLRLTPRRDANTTTHCLPDGAHLNAVCVREVTLLFVRDDAIDHIVLVCGIEVLARVLVALLQRQHHST